MQWSILTAILGDVNVCCVLGSSALYSLPLETLTFSDTWLHWKSQLDTGNFEILAVILSCNLIYLTVDSTKLHKLPIGAQLVAQLGRTSAFEILKFKSSLDLNLFVWLLSILWVLYSHVTTSCKLGSCSTWEAMTSYPRAVTFPS